MPRSEAENQRLREQQRAKILDAARTVFARSGMAGSMAEIAATAGVSQGLAYRYFASKEEIYYALVEQALNTGVTDVEGLPEMSGSPGQRLEALISLVLTARREHPEFFQLLYHVLSDGAAPHALLEQAAQRGQFFANALRRLILDGQATGEIADGDPDQLVLAFLAYLDGLTHFSLYDPEQYKEHFPDVAIILRLFKPR